MIIRHCFYCESYLGVLHIDKETNILSFEYHPDEVLCEGARNFIKYTNWRNSDDIWAFIGERVIPDERPDKSLWITGLGGQMPISLIDAFLLGHGMSVNDCFWIDEDRNSKFWDEKMRDAVYKCN